MGLQSAESKRQTSSSVMLYIIVGLAIIACAQAQVIRPGRCPDVPTQQVFDLERYMGTWYEITKLPTIFQPDQKCVRARYNIREDGLVRVRNDGINLRSGSYSSIEGEAIQFDPSDPAKLGVRFFEGQDFGMYWVIETDYNYTLIWSCGSLGGLAHTQSSWILARENTLVQRTVDYLKRLAGSYGIAIEEFETTDNVGCSYPDN